ncbi:MAG: hypothetical protein KF766_11620 [Rhodocyclaceae bacterium]|nr:hypothetical protein [Rhodocyclaceae bacterium]
MMAKIIGWLHPGVESDEWDGFNDSGIEHFSGSPVRHLAREINQNSLDAASSATEPVRVTMRLIQAETATIPDLNELKKTIALCRDAAKNESDKARLFFENASAELEKKKIAVLEICDYNTMGMPGPSVNGTPFYAFTKAPGQSKKPGDDATGSFGIGKFAPYAVSKLRTVFVSTVYADETGQHHQLTQGKSVLMSHNDETTLRQGKGYWGVTARCQPAAGVIQEIPSWIRRAENVEAFPSSTGTKLTVLAFDYVAGWQDSLAVSVVENFFGAINAGKLEVEIDGKYYLSKETITEFLENTAIKAAIGNDKDEPEQFDNCRKYLTALKDGTEIVVETSEQKDLGLCELRILIDEALPKKVCFLRNGMFISDSLSVPGLKSFSDFKEFIAVVECKSKKGIALLRAMEPPRHDNFEPARLGVEQKKGQRALKELAAWIREMLKRHAKNPVSEVTTLDELKEYFADESGEGGEKGSEEMDPYGRIIIRAKPLKQKLESSSHMQAEGVEGDDGGEDSGGGGADGEGGGDGMGGEGAGEGGSGSEGNGAKAKPVVAIGNIRAFAADGRRKKLLFTPNKSGKITLAVMEAGADTDYNIGIESSDVGSVEKGRVLLDVNANSRVTLNVSLTEEFSGALKVVAYEI